VTALVYYTSVRYGIKALRHGGFAALSAANRIVSAVEKILERVHVTHRTQAARA
jgi:hypothetical protein